MLHIFSMQQQVPFLNTKTAAKPLGPLSGTSLENGNTPESIEKNQNSFTDSGETSSEGKDEGFESMESKIDDLPDQDDDPETLPTKPTGNTATITDPPPTSGIKRTGRKGRKKAKKKLQLRATNPPLPPCNPECQAKAETYHTDDIQESAPKCAKEFVSGCHDNPTRNVHCKKEKEEELVYGQEAEKQEPPCETSTMCSGGNWKHDLIPETFTFAAYTEPLGA